MVQPKKDPEDEVKPGPNQGEGQPPVRDTVQPDSGPGGAGGMGGGSDSDDTEATGPGSQGD
ncbi:hypothetical protein [Actinomadura hibisca]|uniref:hypothetical protein n=1 Tax=Actinomadura hibisca TaxID=68565 RepID=UPI00082BB018|nr:hypothetical protein [Actinomadura hibisca]